jgi:hypothetical protein
MGSECENTRIYSQNLPFGHQSLCQRGHLGGISTFISKKTKGLLLVHGLSETPEKPLEGGSCTYRGGTDERTVQMRTQIGEV